MEYTPFSEKDFDAYLDQKWQSHVFNRERLEVKEKLKTLGKIISPSLVSPDSFTLDFEVSAEHPALCNQQRVQNQHLFFSRCEEARSKLDPIIAKRRSMADLIGDTSPLRNHILLSVMIDKSQLEMSLKLHADAAVDRENLQRKCQEYFHREMLVHLIRELPEAFLIGISGQEESPVRGFDDAALERLLEALPGSSSWLEIRKVLRRDDPVVLDPGFVDVARDDLTSLLPIMSFIAWSKDNDFTSIRETLKQQAADKETRGLGVKDQVRVVQGVFTGKVGEVQAIDTKGKLKVRLGSMLVTLNSADVVRK